MWSQPSLKDCGQILDARGEDDLFLSVVNTD